MGQYGPEIKKPSELTPSPLLLKYLTISDNYNDLFVEFMLRKLPLLDSIDVGRNCFNRTRVVVLFNLKNLKSLRIGIRSFALNSQERSDGLLHIANCPKLVSIVANGFAFADYQEMVLENLPSLITIDLNMSTFIYAPLFSLIGFAFPRG